MSDTFALTKDTMDIYYIGPKSCDLSMNNCVYGDWEFIEILKW